MQKKLQNNKIRNNLQNMNRTTNANMKGQTTEQKLLSTNNIIQTQIREFSLEHDGDGDEHPNTS
jgi:hypothetical protein